MGTVGRNIRDEEWLARLAVIAGDLPKVGGQRVAAALVEGRTLLAVGVNEKRSHPLQARFASNEDAIYLHAEISTLANALRRLREYHYLGKATMYVCRVGAHGEMRLAKPCEGCQRALASFEVGRVIWSD